MLEIFGLILESIGIAIILISQAIFFWKARKEYGNLGIAFLEIQAARWYGVKVEELAKDKQKLKEAFEKFPHAKLLYDNFKISVIGLAISIVGLLLQLVGIFV